MQYSQWLTAALVAISWLPAAVFAAPFVSNAMIHIQEQPAITLQSTPDIRAAKINAVNAVKSESQSLSRDGVKSSQKVAGAPVKVKTVAMDAIADGIYDLGFDGNYLWGVDGVVEKPHYIDKINLQTGDVISYFKAPNQSTIADGSISLAYANSYLWVLNFMDDVVYKVDPANGNHNNVVS